MGALLRLGQGGAEGSEAGPLQAEKEEVGGSCRAAGHAGTSRDQAGRHRLTVQAEDVERALRKAFGTQAAQRGGAHCEQRRVRAPADVSLSGRIDGTSMSHSISESTAHASSPFHLVDGVTHPYLN